MGDRDAMRRFVDEAHRARDVGDIEAIRAMLTPATRFRISGTEGLGTFTQLYDGREAILAAVENLAAAWDLSGLKTVSFHVDGDTALVHRHGEIRFLPTDTAITTEMMEKITVRDDRLVEYLQFVDTFALAHAAGML